MVRQLTAAKPLSKSEIIAALDKTGRKFSKGYLSVLLYTKGNFKRANGKFTPQS
jgi:hypothetical protein